MDHTIDASYVQIHAQPAEMHDGTKTRLGIEIYAATVDVTGQVNGWAKIMTTLG